MAINPDYKDLFQLFADENVEYLIVGAYAVTFHGQPRYTKDVDIFVRPTLENARRVWQALAAFGAPLGDVSIDDFRNPNMVFQIGVEPNRIDILMGITGITFDRAWPNRSQSSYGGVPIHILGKAELIANKKAAGRPQDLLDIRNLEP